jgi:hypothetical protein
MEWMDLLFHFDEIDVEKIPSAFKTHPVKYMPYRYEDINANILAKTPADNVHRNKMTIKGLYNNYKYHLFIMEFMNHIDKERNMEIRNIITDCIKSTDFKKRGITDIQNKIKELVVGNKIKKEDGLIIMEKVNLFYFKSTAKKEDLISSILLNVYEFDKKILTHIIRVKKIATEITAEQASLDITENSTFPNIYLPCAKTENVYCNAGKLILDNVDTYVELLCNDLRNPIKYQYMNSGIFTDNTIEFLMFEKHVDESVYVKLV